MTDFNSLQITSVNDLPSYHVAAAFTTKSSEVFKEAEEISPRNQWDMKNFYERFCLSDIKVRQAVALLSWGHIIYCVFFGKLVMMMLLCYSIFYAQETVTKAWNRDLLLNAINLNMYGAQALTKVDNYFGRPLPAKQAQYANEVFNSSHKWYRSVYVKYQFLDLYYSKILCTFAATYSPRFPLEQRAQGEFFLYIYAYDSDSIHQFSSSRFCIQKKRRSKNLLSVIRLES